MCGIAGIVRHDERKIEARQLKEMTDTIIHRGPDGEGQWVNEKGNVGLGHRRLSIIDLSDAGSQPMHYANGRYTITFNGEIYNYIELREDLVKRGYDFTSHSDTEVLLALFDYKREECVQLLDGMFAFAIWDEQEQELFCARDRFGEKPFYYSSDKGAFAFASEMKELWALHGSREPESVMIYNYLRFGFLTHPQQPEKTFYKGIFNLPAAHFIWVKNKTTTIKKYWEIDIKQTAQISTDDAIDRFRVLFRESVKRRLRSDVPVGSSLSGGLDSSLVVCVIDELLRSQGKSISTFSARFRDFVKDESKYQDYVISKTKADAHFIYSESDVLDRELDKIFFHQEEPFGSASILVQYQVFELAKKNKVTVLLDGQGADEILAGYTPYYQTFFNELRTYNPAKYREELDAYMNVHERNPINPPTPQSNTWKSALARQAPGLVETLRKFKRHAQLKPTGFMTKDFFSSYSNSPAPTFDYDINNLNSHLWAHTSSYGLGTLLRYADRNSMAHSREVRLPFLSHELVEFLFSLPSTFKINSGWTKHLMRVAFENTLPQEITWRKDKIGYEPPQKEWMGKPEIMERIMDSRKKLVENHILNPKVLDRIPSPEAANTDNDGSWKHIMVAKLLE